MKWTCTLLLLLIFAAGCRTNVTPEQQVKDAETLATIKAKLAQEVGVGTVTNISVNVTNGVVTLSGQVNTADQKARAGAIAQSVPNVVRVNNNLQVTGKPS